MADSNRDGVPSPEITFVLPVRNESFRLDAVLSDLRAQEGPPGRIEILVVDGASTDDTKARAEAVARSDPRVRVLDNPRRLSSAARAIGAAAARGRYVAFVDGHCRVPSKTLATDMIALFESSGAACLARPQPLESADGGLVARAIAAARHSPFGHSGRSEIWKETEGPVSPLSSGAMYRREVFEKVGTFDSSFDACEDVEFNWRVEQAGLSCWSSPKLAVVYEPRKTFAGLFRQMERYGRGRARLHRKHPSAFTLESLVPVAFVLGLAVLLASPFLPWPWWFVARAPYALYASLSLLFSVSAAATRRAWGVFPLLPVAFLVIHVGLGVGYLAGRLSRTPVPRADGAP